MQCGSQERMKRIKSKSYLYKYFGSYSIMLAVPLLTIVLLFSQSQKLVKEQIQIASHNTLKQFFERIDDIVKDSYEICITIANDQKCKQYPRYAELRPDKTTYETWELSGMLRNYAGERYHDIFVYYPIDDRVVSAQNSSLKLDMYYDVYYANNSAEDENAFREEFRKLAECTSGRPMLYNLEGTDSYLCMAMRWMNSRNEDNSYTIVVVFDQKYISNILYSVEDTNLSGNFMVHNAERETVFSTDEELMAYDLEGYEMEGVSFEQQIGGDRYVLQVQESQTVDAYYTYGMSRAYYWEKLFDLYIICGVGAFITIVIGIITAMEEARRVYKPIELLVENLKKLGASDYNEREKSEFEFIEALFSKEVDEKRMMNNALRKGQEIKREKFIYSLLNGSKESLVEDSNDIFRVNGIDLCSDYFYVVVIDIEKEGIVEDELEFFVLSNVFCELINEENQGYMVLLPASRYAILINARKEMEREHLYALLGEGKDFLKQHYEIIMTLGVSAIQEGVSGIHEAYKEACFALRYKYLLGKESIIDYGQVAGRGFEYVPASESQLLFKVSEYLFEGEKKKSAQELVEKIMYNYGIGIQASMETVECFKFETASVLNRVMVQGGYWSEQGKMIVQELLISDTLQEFTQKLVELLSDLHKKQQEKVGERDVCARAFEYIEAHYAEQSLSLTFLGELLEISPSYLSKLFKEKYRISIPDFITHTRIDNAKLQLRSTQYGIGRIAEDNGFLSSSVFIKTFKKMEGITPGIYRGFFEKDK